MAGAAASGSSPGLGAAFSMRAARFRCPSCEAEQDILCRTQNACFLNEYRTSCERCGWTGNCRPFKAVDLQCPGCGSFWKDARIEVSNKCWVDLTGPPMHCEQCDADVVAHATRALAFRCGSAFCAAEQLLLCDPWSEPGPAPVRCRICMWAGEALLRDADITEGV
eukprot:TRINITY_DN68962_c0_g1_i1.p2 TRINITY_DN68962_c0_g1~~TRINITY_DN68962_c0_g1_i1.p2  ORF type:complete len:166 (+),score=17.71 TRINITY_DN68962_c0_g1_i1:73-570(+)